MARDQPPFSGPGPFITEKQREERGPVGMGKQGRRRRRRRSRQKTLNNKTTNLMRNEIDPEGKDSCRLRVTHDGRM